MSELNAEALDVVGAYLTQLAPIPREELSRFAAQHLTLVSYRRKAFFTQPGDPSARLGVVVEGLFRVYYVGLDGSAHVRNFCERGTPVGAYGSILSGKPANVAIEALEDSKVLELPYAALVRQYETGSVWERLGRRIAEEHYISRERREHALLTMDAAGRYARFREEFPTLSARLKRSDIASYIRVRPETLSRLSSMAIGSRRRLG
jgi:CRP-like cAMP-binding protein